MTSYDEDYIDALIEGLKALKNFLKDGIKNET